MKKNKVLVKAVLAVMFSATVLNACKKDKSMPARPVRTEKKSFIQVIHAAPKLGDVEIMADNKAIPGKISYLSQPSSYLSVQPKSNVSVKLKSSGTFIADGNYSFEEGKYYTIYAYDTLDATKKIKYFLLKDSFPKPLVGKSNLRFLHLSPGGPEVNIDCIKVNGTDSVRIATAATYIGSNSTLASSLATFSTLNSGEYSMKAKIRLRNNADSLLSTSTVKIENGKAYTLILSGFVKATEQRKLELRLLKHPN